MGGYLLLLSAALVRGDWGRFAGLALSTVGFGVSAYLTYLEVFTIEAICQWCVTSAALMTALFAVNATRALAYLGRPPRPVAAPDDGSEQEKT